MVRLKNRYILFDVLHPVAKRPRSKDQEDRFFGFSESPKDALVQLHATSPASINARSIVGVLKRVVRDHFGELGAGTVGQLIIVKYFSNKTSSGIIRCSRTDFQVVVAALALTTKVEHYDVVLRCVHVSGTIRKVEDYLIRRTRKLMIDLGREKSDSLDEYIAMFSAGAGADPEE